MGDEKTRKLPKCAERHMREHGREPVKHVRAAAAALAVLVGGCGPAVHPVPFRSPLRMTVATCPAGMDCGDVRRAVALWQGCGAAVAAAGDVAPTAAEDSISIEWGDLSGDLVGEYEPDGRVVVDPAQWAKLDSIFTGHAPEMRRVVLAHELGHAYGLEHTAERWNVMFPTLTGAIHFPTDAEHWWGFLDTLGTDDRAQWAARFGACE